MSDSTSSPESSPGNPNNLYSTIAVAGGTILIVCLIWKCLRNRPNNRTFFYRKCYATNFGRDPVGPSEARADGWFNWIPYVWNYDLKKGVLPNYGGLDMVLYIRFLYLAMVFFGVSSLFVVISLIPTYATGTNKSLVPTDINFVRGLDVISLGNLPQEDNKMWVTWISVFVITAFSAILCYKYWKDSFEYNMLDVTKDHMRSRTVMVHNVPKRFARDSDIDNEFKRIYDPSNVAGGRIVPNVNELRELQDERMEMAQKLKITRDFIAEHPEKPRPEHRPKFLPCISDKVDSENYFQTEIARLDALIDQHKTNEREGMNVDKNTREGFVVFKLRSAALASAQTNHMDPPQQMVCEEAPEPSNIFWKNLSVYGIQRTIRTFVSFVLLVLLFLFWAIPVTFFQSIASLDTLSRFSFLSFLTPVVNSFPSFVTGIIQGILPSLALVIFMALLPKILGAIHGVAAPKTRARLENQVMKSYYAFLFLNVFLVTVIAGSLFKVIQKIVDSPTTTPSLLATGISAQTSFYINYVLVNMAANYLFLTRLIPFLVSRIMKLLAKTKEEKAKKDIPPPLSVNTKIAKELILFSICLLYISIGPLISVFAFIYFLFAYMTSKHAVIFSYSPAFEGAKITPTVVTVITSMTVFYQIIMVGLFSIKYFFPGIIVIICAPFTILWYFYLRNRFARGFKHVPVSLLPANYKTEQEYLNALDTYHDPALGTAEEYSSKKFEIVYPDARPVSLEERKMTMKDKEMEEGRPMYTSSPIPRSD